MLVYTRTHLREVKGWKRVWIIAKWHAGKLYQAGVPLLFSIPGEGWQIKGHNRGGLEDTQQRWLEMWTFHSPFPRGYANDRLVEGT